MTTAREAFEAWANGAGYWSTSDGRYDYPLGRALWRAWQAACAWALEKDRCAKCNTPLVHGVAIESTYTGSPDFPGGEVVTMSSGGPGRLIECWKCPACGWSVK